MPSSRARSPSCCMARPSVRTPATTCAGLITRGLNEMLRLNTAIGGRPETLMGLAGLGDLVLTCTGDLSRNRRLGLGLARGEPLDAILQRLGHVAEGVG